MQKNNKVAMGFYIETVAIVLGNRSDDECKKNTFLYPQTAQLMPFLSINNINQTDFVIA